MYEMECTVLEQSLDKQAEWCGWSCIRNAGDLEFDALVSGKPVVMFEQSRWAGRLTAGDPGDYAGDGVLCTLQTSDVFRRYADKNRVGVIKPSSDESSDDGFRHVLSDGRANVTHSPVYNGLLPFWILLAARKETIIIAIE